MSSSFRRSRVISSSAPNGSSNKKTFGSSTSERASEARIFMPPESCLGYFSSNPVSPTSWMASAARRRRSPAGTFSSSASSSTLRSTFRHCSNVASWNTYPRLLRSTSTAPEVAGLRPEAMRKQRALAATGGTDDRDELTGANVEGGLAQCVGAVGKDHRHPVETQCGSSPSFAHLHNRTRVRLNVGDPDRAQCITMPPVTFIACPVQYDASSEARKTAMLATSEGSARRPRGDFDDHSRTISSVRVAAPISVRT